MSRALLFLSVLVASAASAAAPEVPEEALASVPESERADWIQRQAYVDALTRRVEEARRELGALELETTLEPGDELEAARDEASGARRAGRAGVRAARHELVAARQVRRGARHEVRIARQAIRVARAREDRAALIEARAGLARAKARVAEQHAEVDQARREVRVAQREARRDTEVADLLVEELEVERDTAADDDGIRLARARLAAIEAERDYEAARLELDRVTTANTYGADLDPEPFRAEVHAAQLRREAAIDALRALEAELAPPVG